MKTIQISVLLSIYQKEKVAYFVACMESILAQTVQPEEILLVKDGPLTAELDQAIADYQEKLGAQLTVYALAENVGLGRALAEGVKQCRNPLIARMDTDDIMREDRLEMQYTEMLTHPELTIVGSDITEFEGEINHVLGKKRMPQTNADIRMYSKRRNPFNHMTVMFKKADILAAGNYQPLPGFEDYYLWIRVLKKGYQAKNEPHFLVYARTGLDMYARRGGWHYLLPGLKARWRIYREGLGSFGDFFIVASVHTFVCLLPNRLRSKVYEAKLRN